MLVGKKIAIVTKVSLMWRAMMRERCAFAYVLEKQRSLRLIHDFRQAFALMDTSLARR